MPDADDTPPPPAPRRRVNPKQTRDDILAAAYEEFVEKGLNGARVDAIAARTSSAKRMIYYYFGSKEQLYLAVLEQAYRDIRAAEQRLGLDGMPPGEAVRRLVEFTFDYDDTHPGFVQLVSVENIHRGRYIEQSKVIRSINIAVIDILTRVLDRGKQQGVFRADADPVDVHMLLSAFCFFRVSNRYTFRILFGRDFAEPETKKLHRTLITETVLRFLEAREA